MTLHGYEASIDLAIEKGPFKWFEPNGFLRSLHMQNNVLPAHPHLERRIRDHGIRNVTIFTIAPTGSTGTMTGTSTGCEPYFAFTYWRNSRLGMAEIVEDVAAEWLTANGYEVTSENLQYLPKYFISAMELTPEEHIRTQAAWQKWICSSISKTCNAPNNHTVEDIANIIDLGYESGLKGFTYYRDGSRDEQVLSTTSAGLFGGTEERPELAILAKLDTASLKGLISVAEGYGLFPAENGGEGTDTALGKQPTTEELTIMLSGCIGGKCSNE
jgi:ribonucleotide reductase alpha subunit